jgi:hypothetical protein
MHGVDAEFGASLLRLWIAAGSAALLVVLCVVAFFQPQPRLVANPVLRVGFVIVGAVFGAVMTWALVDPVLGGVASERRALELRGQQLSSQVLVPGSPLACLDALVGESVEAACEKLLFGSPATVAAASAYVGAELTLLANTTAFARRQGADLEPMLAPLRRSLETDRFGFVAYVLTIRDGCTAQNCKALSLFRNANRVRTNLTTAALERYLEHYAIAWGAGSDAPVAEAAQAPAGSAAAPAGQGPRKIVNIDFPSAASIPPVSIMNPEPTGPVLPGAAAAAASNPNATPQRHARKPSSSPNPNPNATITGQSSQSGVEPIWPEPMPAPPQPQAPQTAAAPAPQTAAAPAPVGGPVQLTPPPTNANTGAPARTQ